MTGRRAAGKQDVIVPTIAFVHNSNQEKPMPGVDMFTREKTLQLLRHHLFVIKQ